MIYAVRPGTSRLRPVIGIGTGGTYCDAYFRDWTLGRIVVGGLVVLFGVPAVCAASPEDVARLFAMIVARESGGDCAAISSTSSAMGCYQLTTAALRDVGWKGENGVWLDNEFGIGSDEEFLQDAAAQYAAMLEYTRSNWRALPPDARGATCRRFGDFRLDDAGLLTGAHILGVGGINQFIRCGMEPDCLRLAAVQANGGDAQRLPLSGVSSSPPAP